MTRHAQGWPIEVAEEKHPTISDAIKEPLKSRYSYTIEDDNGPIYGREEDGDPIKGIAFALGFTFAVVLVFWGIDKVLLPALSWTLVHIHLPEWGWK